MRLTGNIGLTDCETKEVIILGTGLAGSGTVHALSYSSFNSSTGTDILVNEADRTAGGLPKTVKYCDYNMEPGVVAAKEMIAGSFVIIKEQGPFSPTGINL